MIDTQPIEQPKRRGRIPIALKTKIEKQIIECNKTLQHPTQQNIADKVGVARQTVSDVLAKYKINKQEVDNYAANQADILMGLQHRITANISDSDIEKASLKDKIVAASICLDKHRLITGQSTSNIANWSVIVSESHRTQVIDNAKVAHSTAECDKAARSDD